MILNGDVGRAALARAKEKASGAMEEWQVEHQEGQLAVDVYETKKEVVIVSTMAGADTSHIEVYIHSDLLTIRGRRVMPVDADEIENTFHQECFWGTFSRSIVLPVEVKADLAAAEYVNGVLTVRVPKQRMDAKIPVVIVEE
ncbi:MAG: hypothetical protein A3C90_02390 [Candidatus Magasanikbacteria bacterium RIFCSPHIGHO2_02_FULL_51_14]|uniref:SHSP domain-containing protein n=1 Tax=Candidatus Magasanikbacteria bacterium RIFCSPHIGHO2_02_FULL_51_14 TaxID=1798683 RepID=A0A1F6MQ90_9BACT|nr:MAG: hypothetical protein A3C90_02390 [Candidatus Magasanikbacteria bacterium RIFCSPHIGHO2_02_FULL_51_14]